MYCFQHKIIRLAYSRAVIVLILKVIYNKKKGAFIMKKNLLILLLLSILSTNISFAEENIAVVDLQKLVNSSGQVKQLKQEHSKKLAELDKIIVNARGEISNEKDPAKVLLLEDKYMNELKLKKILWVSSTPGTPPAKVRILGVVQVCHLCK